MSSTAAKDDPPNRLPNALPKGATNWGFCTLLFSAVLVWSTIGVVTSLPVPQPRAHHGNLNTHPNPLPPPVDNAGFQCKAPKCKEYDIVIYGSTPAGIGAAIQAHRMNKTAVIVTPDHHIGGLTASGLGWTDSKNGDQIGGIAREFYKKIYDYYQADSAWDRETRAAYNNKHIQAQPGEAIEDSKKVQWTFEPHVAEHVLDVWVNDYNISVVRDERLLLAEGGVIVSGPQIKAITMESGSQFAGSAFIDASYEGDLTAAAGIPYKIGRESTSQYDESLAGIRIDTTEDRYNGIDPYRTKGDPDSGLLPGIQRTLSEYKSLEGHADPNRLQSYNYRLPLTKVVANRIPFSKPEDYDPEDFELLLRYIEAGYHGPFFTFQLMPNLKTDTNAQGAVSTDLLGGNWDDKSNYVIDSYATRDAIAQRHKSYTQGFFWTLISNPRIPKDVRDRQALWGYAKDEFSSNGYFPYSLYVRETRRMEGLYTITQKQVQSSETYPQDAVAGLGCYSLDSHMVERININNHIYDEGLVHEPNFTPFTIPYNVMVPQPQYATNLINPVTVSSSHVAYSAIRMEPTYWILGQTAGTAAVFAIEDKVSVQNVNRNKLSTQLKSDQQRIQWPL